MNFIHYKLCITTASTILSLAAVVMGSGIFAGKANALQFSFFYEYESVTASGIFETTDDFFSIQSFGQNYDVYRIVGINNGLRNGVTINLLPSNSYSGNDNFIIPQLTAGDEEIGPFFTKQGFSFLADGKTYAVYSNGFKPIESEARPDGGIGPSNFITSYSVTPATPAPIPESSTLLGYLVSGGAILLWKKTR
jgi:hypothetical protein